MKKVLAALLVMAMLISAVAVIPAGAADKATIKSVVITAAGKDDADKTTTLIDGTTGNNKTKQADGAWCDKTIFYKCAKGSVMSYGETAGSDTYTYNASYNPETDVTTSSVTLSDSTTYTYWYGLKAELETASTVSGVKIYMHGYKPGVLDINFAILVSADGTTWTKVKECTNLIGTDGLLTAAGQQEYVGAINEVGKAASDADNVAYISWEGTGVENVKYVMYVSNQTRYNNAYYTMRFTEFEVYTASNPSTGDNAVVFLALGSVAVIACAIVTKKRREY